MAPSSAKKHRGVYEHPTGSGVWWVQFFVDGRRHREKVGGKQAAINRYQQRKTEAREERLPVKERPVLFGQFVADYLETVRQKQASFETTKRHARVWCARFEGRTLKSILPLEVEKWAARRRAEVGPATVNRELAFLRRVFNVARKNKLASENPVEVDHFYDEPSGRVRFLTDEEEVRLRAELTDYEWKIVLFGMATGMRQGAQFRLHWSKVDLPNRFATIPKKSRGGVAVQRVPLNNIALDVLRSLPSRFTGGYVFPSAKGSTPLNAKNFLNRVFYPALKQAGIEDFHWHDLRHTFASRLAMRNVHQKAIKELMGHETLAMTDRYMHLSPVHLHEAANKFYFGGSSGGSSTGHKRGSRVTHSARKPS